MLSYNWVLYVLYGLTNNFSISKTIALGIVTDQERRGYEKG